MLNNKLKRWETRWTWVLSCSQDDNHIRAFFLWSEIEYMENEGDLFQQSEKPHLTLSKFKNKIKEDTFWEYTKGLFLV